ncbi:hypothetical protein ACGFX8_34930 [Streptomyces sp. NPDC048362]|uniref:hypothetical protein n=1 Tax=Streptomyces sp. NPDC048362 TaxID=3365539 RepID=UPI00371D2412
MRYLSVSDLMESKYYGSRIYPGPDLTDAFRDKCLAVLTAYPQPVHEKIAEVIKGKSSGKIAIAAQPAQGLPGAMSYLNVDEPDSYLAFYAIEDRALYVPDVTKYKSSPYRVQPFVTVLHEAVHAFENPNMVDVGWEWPLSESEAFIDGAFRPWAQSMREFSDYVFDEGNFTESQRSDFDRMYLYLSDPQELFADGMAQYYCKESTHPDSAVRQLHRSLVNDDWLAISLCAKPELKSDLIKARDGIYEWFANYNSPWNK